KRKGHRITFHDSKSPGYAGRDLLPHHHAGNTKRLCDSTGCFTACHHETTNAKTESLARQYRKSLFHNAARALHAELFLRCTNRSRFGTGIDHLRLIQWAFPEPRDSFACTMFRQFQRVETVARGLMRIMRNLSE